MKTSILVAAAVLFVFSTTQAQLINGYGVKLGMSYANQNFDYTDKDLTLDTKYLSGTGAGVFVEWLKLPLIGVTTEVLYVQKGMKMTSVKTTVSDPSGVGTIETNNRVNYLSIPVLAKLKFGGVLLSPYIVAGPRFDVLLSYDSNEKQLYDDFKSTVVGGDIGVGAELSFILPVALSAELRYSTDFDNSYETDLLQVKNKAFLLLLGMRL
jgi:hypothetical protein